MDSKSARLARLHRVRGLQLSLVQAEEAQAQRRLNEEQALRTRIAQLAAEVAPVPTPAPDAALTMIASAHYRDRLNQTAMAAEQRVAGATRQLDQARARTVEARRDETAMEKLMQRAAGEAAARARRAMESLPPGKPPKRHDPC
ncbi:hypothetical protein ACNI3Q_11215 [Sphingomonas sp. FW199]|uniref:hypothetical protein n=1 Tax=unclassified Sphingomonas TaxID=196159 RepID=UPI0021A54486|nr:hypothetical protein [Sphingomonas sp. BGYR3]MDG5488300.1 hypothetical protein [Sphingomonas sp. BGYR3]